MIVIDACSGIYIWDLLILRRLIFSYVSVTHKNVYELHFSGRNVQLHFSERNVQLHFSARKVQFVLVALFFLNCSCTFSEVIET